MISDLEKKQQSSASLKDEVKRLNKLAAEQKEKIAKLQNTSNEQQAKLDEMVDVPTDVMELKVIIGRQRAEIEAFEDKISDRDWRINELESELGMIKKQRGELRDKLAEMRKKYGESGSVKEDDENRIKELEGELNTTREFLEQMGVARGDIGDLRIKLGQIDARVLEKEKVIKKLEDQLNKREEREIKLLADIERMQSSMDNINLEIKNAVAAKEAELRSQMMNIQTELNQKKVDYAKLETELTKKDAQRKVLEGELEQAGSVDSERERRLANVEKLEAHVKKLQKMLEMEPMFKIYFILQEAKTLEMTALAKAIGLSLGETRRLVFRLVKEALLVVEGEIIRFPM